MTHSGGDADEGDARWWTGGGSGGGGGDAGRGDARWWGWYWNMVVVAVTRGGGGDARWCDKNLVSSA